VRSSPPAATGGYRSARKYRAPQALRPGCEIPCWRSWHSRSGCPEWVAERLLPVCRGCGWGCVILSCYLSDPGPRGQSPRRQSSSQDARGSFTMVSSLNCRFSHADGKRAKARSARQRECPRGGSPASAYPTRESQRTARVAVAGLIGAKVGCALEKCYCSIGYKIRLGGSADRNQKSVSLSAIPLSAHDGVSRASWRRSGGRSRLAARGVHGEVGPSAGC